MVKVISFTIFGGLKKYCLGLLKNIELVQEHLPDYEVWIYGGNDVPEDYITQYKSFPKVRYMEGGKDGLELTCNRFFTIDDPSVDINFSRDADSRITERDRYLMKEFENSDKQFHIIREHFWHKRRISAGMWGVKKGCIKENLENLYLRWISKNESRRGVYGTDELFLEQCVYPLIKDQALIHTNIVGFNGEQITNISKPREDDADFIGNVILFDKDGNEYPEFKFSEYDLAQHLRWLLLQNRWDLIVLLTRDFCERQEVFFKYSARQRYSILDSVFVSYYYMRDIENCKKTLSKFRWTHIDDHIIYNSSFLIQLEKINNNKKIVGTTDPCREAGEGEFVVCYGNYPHDIYNLPHSEQPNKVYRHAIYKDLLKHDFFEYHPCWDKIDQIYILNLKTRKDRWMSILVELCNMGAPLDKVYHYLAPIETVTGNKTVDKYLGATKNHLDVVDHFLQNNFDYCLVLEDDLTFTTDISRHQKDLQEFFDREYDFDVCMISGSKYHELKPHDDLLVKSYQECTTTSGYILHKKTASNVRECFREGYDKLKETGQHHIYVCDRYWSKLQKDGKFFLFKRKFGYQRANYSSITETIDCHFD